MLHAAPFDAVPPDEDGALVGRSAELAEVTELLGRARLVTVTGAGGVGKTCLARWSAARAAARFGDAASIIDLSPLRDPELITEAVTAGLGLPERDTRPRMEIILDHLRERELLLVLDTCEHLIEACALFAEAVLAAAPGVTILATSRQPLDAAGEQVFRLAPLAVPGDPGAGPCAAGTGGAVELFARRAAAVVPGFTVTEGNLADVTGLCRRLDGLPLALELAAAQLRTLPLDRLAERLGRHRVLRDAIGWSYELCDPAEQLLWERASVFAGPFGMDALKQVCAGRGLARDAIMGTVFGLVDKSVLLRAADDDSGSCFRMLDTIREYGAERLAASGSEPEVRARLIARYRAMAEEFDACPLVGQLSRYRVLRREHASIRAAFDYAFGLPGQEHAAASLAVSLHWYWQISGLLGEGRYWLTRVLELSPGPAPERALALGLRGFLSAYGGEAATSLDDTTAAIAMAEDSSELRIVGRAWLYHVRALLTVGRLAEAEEASHKAATLLEGAGDVTVLPILDVMLAFKYWASGELEACLARCDSGLRRTPADLGERWASSYLLGLTGLAMFARGEQERGSASTRRAMAMKAELDDTAGIAYGLGTLAMMAAGEGRFERVTWLLGAADPLWDRLGSVLGGTPEMTERTREITVAARDALGDGRYTRLRRAAAHAPLDVVVTLAVQNGDELPAIAPAG